MTFQRTLYRVPMGPTHQENSVLCWVNLNVVLWYGITTNTMEEEMTKLDKLLVYIHENPYCTRGEILALGVPTYRYYIDSTSGYVDGNGVTKLQVTLDNVGVTFLRLGYNDSHHHPSHKDRPRRNSFTLIYCGKGTWKMCDNDEPCSVPNSKRPQYIHRKKSMHNGRKVFGHTLTKEGRQRIEKFLEKDCGQLKESHLLKNTVTTLKKIKTVMGEF